MPNLLSIVTRARGQLAGAVRGAVGRVLAAVARPWRPVAGYARRAVAGPVAAAVQCGARWAGSAVRAAVARRTGPHAANWPPAAGGRLRHTAGPSCLDRAPGGCAVSGAAGAAGSSSPARRARGGRGAPRVGGAAGAGPGRGGVRGSVSGPAPGPIRTLEKSIVRPSTIMVDAST